MEHRRSGETDFREAILVFQARADDGTGARAEAKGSVRGEGGGGQEAGDLQDLYPNPGLNSEDGLGELVTKKGALTLRCAPRKGTPSSPGLSALSPAPCGLQCCCLADRSEPW